MFTSEVEAAGAVVGAVSVYVVVDGVVVSASVTGRRLAALLTPLLLDSGRRAHHHVRRRRSYRPLPRPVHYVLCKQTILIEPSES